MNYEKLTKAELIKKIKTLEKKLAKDTPRHSSRIKANKKDFSLSEKDKILHELHSKEIQLEMQNLELTEAQSLLEESRNRYADLFDFAPLGFVSLNQKGIIIEINFICSQMLGIEKQKFEKAPFVTFVNKTDKQKFYEHLKKCKTNNRVTTQLSLRRNDGKFFDMELSSVSVSDFKNRTTIIRTAVIDISERKQAERAFYESEEKFRQLAENINDIFYIIDLENKKIFYVSPAFENIFKRSSEELYQNPGSWALSIKEEDRERIFKAVEKQKLTGKFNEEYRIVRPDNSIRWIHARAFPIKNDTGTFVKIAGIAEDVTDRKEIENILRESGQRLSTIFREIPSMIIISSLKDGRCIDVNDSFTIITGYKRHEVITRYIEDIGIYINTSDLDFISKKVMIEGFARDLEVNIRTKKGAVKTILLNASKIEIKEELCILSVGTDISERKKSREQIESSLKEKEIMLKEMHHRVKNNLQVVSSLLNLQSNYITDTKAIEAFRISQNRIMSMALLHEKLYKAKNISQINFKDYIKDLTFNLTNSYSLTPNLVNLGLTVDNVPINMDIALNIGLIISELVSNSLKHAFPQLSNLENPSDYHSENEKIEINISLQRKNEDNLIMNVKDNGVGFPTHLNFKKTDSLGLQLVNTLVEQIGGNIELKRNGGTEFEIVIPSKKS